MKCPFCSSENIKVIDSRPAEDNNAIRRRRQCEACGRRFTTYEKVEHVAILVVKRDGRRESFDSEKIRGGIIKACEKRPVSMDEIDAMVSDIEREVYNSLIKEISSARIGDLVMEKLRSGSSGSIPLPMCGLRRCINSSRTSMNSWTSFGIW